MNTFGESPRMHEIIVNIYVRAAVVYKRGEKSTYINNKSADLQRFPKSPRPTAVFAKKTDSNKRARGTAIGDAKKSPNTRIRDARIGRTAFRARWPRDRLKWDPQKTSSFAQHQLPPLMIRWLPRGDRRGGAACNSGCALYASRT